jgi:hypothetical protein
MDEPVLPARRWPFDPNKKLQGSGNVARHIRLPSASTLDEPAVRALMREAVSNAKVQFDPSGMQRLIIKSISAKQRPRRPAENPVKGRSGKAGKN